jgi:MoaD family protein
MPVKIKFFATLRQEAQVDCVEIEAGNVAQALKILARDFADKKEFVSQLKKANAILNGQNILWLRGASTKLADGDELVFFPPVGGG